MEAPQRTQQLRACVECLEHARRGPVGVGFKRRAIWTLELATAARPSLGVVDGEVDEDSARVCARQVHPAHARPAPGDAQQGLLDEILGLLQVPDDEVPGAQQVTGASVDESLELDSRPAASGQLHQSHH